MLVGLSKADIRARDYFENITSLEGRLITDSSFGDNITEDIRDKARKIIGHWEEYISLEGASIQQRDYLVAQHVYSLGAWLDEEISFEKLFRGLNNTTRGDLSENQRKKVQEYLEKYRFPKRD